MSEQNPHVVSHGARLARDKGAAGPPDVAAGMLALADTIGAAALFDTLVQLLPEAAIFVVDAERNILCWNDGAERLLGYRREDVLGRYCLTANRCHQCMLGCGISEYGRVSDVPLVLLDAEGRQVRVRKTGQALRDAEGRFCGGIEVLRPEPSEARSPASMEGAARFGPLVARDPEMRRVLATAALLAEEGAPALLMGEPGVGLTSLAEAIHHHADQGAPFVPMAASVAVERLAGLHEGGGGAWDGGTLWIDGVDGLSHEAQERLAATIDAARGDEGAGPATRWLLGARRPDALRSLALRLRDTLRGGRLEVPPLRARRGDVELLVWHTLEGRNSRGGRQVHHVAPDAMRLLLDHPWRRNVAGLIDAVDYAYAVGQGSVLSADQLPPELRAPETQVLRQPPSPRKLSQDELRDAVLEALGRADGHIGRAAELLGVSRPTLWRWRRQLGIEV